MSSPKIIVQILVTGTRILGKAFFEAGRQAVKNAKQSPQGIMGNDAAGVGHANSGSMTDQITRQHRMTLDEAHLILNTKRGDVMEEIMKHHDHLFKANSPLPKPDKPLSAKQSPPPSHSHYLQSKVVRARERIEAELKIVETAEATTETVAPGTSPAPAPPPPPPHDTPSGRG